MISHKRSGEHSLFLSSAQTYTGWWDDVCTVGGEKVGSEIGGVTEYSGLGNNLVSSPGQDSVQLSGPSR